MSAQSYITPASVGGLGTVYTFPSTITNLALTTATSSNVSATIRLPKGVYILYNRLTLTGQDTTILTKLRYTTTTNLASVNIQDAVISSEDFTNSLGAVNFQYSEFIVITDTLFNFTTSLLADFSAGTLTANSFIVNAVKIA